MLNRTVSKRTASKRTAKFVSAIFASLLAGTPLTTVSHGAAATSGDCLSGPKDAAPQGGHWYYRIDYATKRHCWYVRDEDKPSRLAAQPPTASADPVPPPTKATTPRAIEDAYAALPLPQRAEPQTSVTTQPPAAAANVASPQSGQPVVTSRWPEPPAVSASASPAPATTGNSITNLQPASGVAPSAATAAVPLAAAESSSESQFGSIPMVLTVIMGALSLAGVMGSAIFRIGSKRWTGRSEMRGARRVNWDFAGADRIAPTWPRSGARMPAGDVPRDRRPADDPNRRIAEMLARLSRSAAT